MIVDRPTALLAAVQHELMKDGSETLVNAELGQSIGWRPPLFQPQTNRAWHLLAALPDSDRWARRITAACMRRPDLRIGVAVDVAIARRPELIRIVDRLQAEVLVLEEYQSGYATLCVAPSVIDLIYARQWILEPSLTRELLDGCFARALANTDSYAKGALLEVTIALLMSQVSGWAVTGRNISTANQEIDVWAVNRNVAGPLSGTQFVLGEGKNWKSNVPRAEYDAFVKKLTGRRGRASLGLMVAARDFEAGTYIEHIRDSKNEQLVLLLNRNRFCAIWRDFRNVTEGLENAVAEASSDYTV